MRAVTIKGSGGPEVLALAEVPDPTPGPGEVRLRVAATAVNRADLLQRQGFYPPPPGVTNVPGLECSGVVDMLGEGVSGVSTGQPVCALLSGGGYAEYVTVPAGQLLPLPRGLSLSEAAALPEVACTVWSNLVMVAGLRPQETVLLHGGGSGVGTFGIQVARALGAKVAVTAGSPAKCTRCAELGAQVTINYRDQDFVAEVRTVTDGRGADVVLDNMGGKYLARNLDVLATGGRLVVIGLQGGRKGDLDLAKLLAKRGSVHATSLRMLPPEGKAEVVRQVREHLWPLVESGQVRPVIDRFLALAEVAEAHRVLERGEAFGKVVLTV